MPPSGPACAYLLSGDDEIAKSERLEALIAERLDAAARDFNLDRLSARDADPSALATLLETPPLLGQARVVVLRDAESASPVVLGAVGDFLRRAPSTTCLVALTVGKAAGEPWTSFRRLGREESFDPPKGAAALKARVRDEVRRAGKEIEERAAGMLAELHPDGSVGLLQDVAKVVAHAGERARVTPADVEAVTVSAPLGNRYTFVDLVGMGRAAEAVAELHALLEQGESPIFLVTLLAQHALLLGGIRACEARGERSSEAIAGALGKSAWILDRRNFRVRGYESPRVQARRYDREAIDAWLASLLQLDLALKSSRLAPGTMMEEWVLRRMAVAPSAA
ncbi:MAG: DNA polymerase III subunit delta [Gemmatimonadota bacterium]